jgi:RNA polymerase sigma-70 factor, ECF subfamily
VASATTNDDVEQRVRAQLAAGEIDAATDAALRGYGPELAGWLCSALPGEADAQDAFGWMSEELWRSLKRYDGRCSIRTWCYMLARHATVRIRRQPRHRHEQLVSSVPSIQHAAAEVWNTTRLNAARERDVYAEIRRSLDEDDQLLLVLRVDRDLPWRDIALVVLGEAAADDELTTKAAALRKQFERVKERLKKLAAEQLDRE